MKSIRNTFGCLLILVGFIASASLLLAQDSIVVVTAQAQGLNLVSPNDLPDNGTFWLVTSNGVTAPLPCPPQDASLPVFQITGSEFIVDASSGLVTTNPDQSIEDAVAALADDVANLISQVQGATPSRSLSRGGAHPMDDSPPDPGDGDDGTNTYTPEVPPPFTPTTNDLWLQINRVTNGVMGWTAYLTIHTPWNDTNLTHDLFYTTSLDLPINWRFLMRCPSTNVVASGICGEVGFFALGQTNGSLTVSTNSTAQQLAQLLVPSGIIVTNAKYTGFIEARGTFAGGNGCGLPLDSGVILASGDITNAIGPNNSSYASTRFYYEAGILYSDTDLSSIVNNGGTEDAAVLEFDIFPTNSFALQFQYVFASEEYPEYIGPWNDPVAIFVSTNYNGTNWINNITNDFALVPGTTNESVSVNSINGGCISDAVGYYDFPTNSQYYVDNHDPSWTAATNAAPAAEFNIQYDGLTILLTAQTFISANVTNHVKIAIADYGDDNVDSAVFIKAWSPSQCP